MYIVKKTNKNYVAKLKSKLNVVLKSNNELVIIFKEKIEIL